MREWRGRPYQGRDWRARPTGATQATAQESSASTEVPGFPEASPDARFVSGVKFPLAIDNGRLALSRDEAKVKQDIFSILATPRGSYVMRPYHGCDLHLRLFEPATVLPMIRDDIATALLRHEPRVDFIGVSVSDLSKRPAFQIPAFSVLGAIEIDVRFRLRDTLIEDSALLIGSQT